ncbi:1352_t:CDS:2 [Cetraspora pellucida]|uniref:1352_t:CDS:1 n=1 Tax=Cetraspora pellucida TaxID=1433469 RepID=A0A9N9AL40_9GLOM|nr:1352_t:CDS:2 [Cetraspora pellucida]
MPWFPEHTTKDAYISLLQQKSPPATELQLKAALLRRAMTDVDRMIKLSEDRFALVSLVQKGLVGEELWNSFLKAEQELQQDLMDVTAEADTFKEDWGQTILQTANQMELLKMDEDQKKKSNAGKDNKGKGKKK